MDDQYSRPSPHHCCSLQHRWLHGLGSRDPSDGPDPEKSGTAATCTYFGQFVDRDLTFDPVGVLTKVVDPEGPKS
jgi:hypothetical protein